MTIQMKDVIERVRNMDINNVHTDSEWTDGFLTGQNTMLDRIVELLELIDNEPDAEHCKGQARHRWLKHCCTQGMPIHMDGV